ncbi:MAG: hypothetical protein VYD64_05535, partial [Pseudomonadota bacterium]|nr:hypothetical protein [Pseudomonadota bacterium]
MRASIREQSSQPSTGKLLLALVLAAGMCWTMPGTAAGSEWRLSQAGPAVDESTAPPVATDDTEAEPPEEASPEAAAPPRVDLPEIHTDLSDLPFAARRMHELLVEAARGGDIEKLRPYIGSGADVTTLSFGGMTGDPIDFLKSTSGDAEGHEILAILLEILEAGYVRVESGTPNELYV